MHRDWCPYKGGLRTQTHTGQGERHAKMKWRSEWCSYKRTDTKHYPQTMWSWEGACRLLTLGSRLPEPLAHRWLLKPPGSLLGLSSPHAHPTKCNDSRCPGE